MKPKFEPRSILAMITLLIAARCVHAQTTAPLATPLPRQIEVTAATNPAAAAGDSVDSLADLELTSFASQIEQHRTRTNSFMIGDSGLALTGISVETSGSSAVEQSGFALFPHRTRSRRRHSSLPSVAPYIDARSYGYIEPYLDRLPLYEDDAESQTAESNRLLDSPRLPPAWWERDVVNQSRPQSNPIQLNVETLLVRTLDNSKFLQGLANLPLIREKSTLEEMSAFDVTSFVESRFTRPSEPVGNQLTVGPGGSNRFRENDFATSAGIARKTPRGARVELAQEVGLLTNNSTFIDPRHQGNARLTLNITQPLLSGAGKSYNTSLIMLAKMDERIAWDEVSKQLQDYLVEVTETYWQLYLERSRFRQKQQYLQQGESILRELEQRREVDAVESQIARVRSAVQTRRSELIRAETSVRNVESRLRGLVNDPMLYGTTIEVVPGEVPDSQPFDVSLGDAMSQALQNRSEIDDAIQKVRAAGVRLSVAKNELMPILDLVLETYVSGLRGSNDIGRAWVDQFSVGEPSYSAGFRYEIPLHNRLSKHRHERRRLEMRQAISQFEFRVEELSSEVEIAVREVGTTYHELISRNEAMAASITDLQYFQRRWQLLPGDSRSASFLLEDILEAQDRVVAAESNFAQAQVNYAMSIVNLKRAMGILLQSERIETGRMCDSGLDRYIFTKPVETVTEESAPMAGLAPVLVDEFPEFGPEPIPHFNVDPVTIAPLRQGSSDRPNHAEGTLYEAGMLESTQVESLR